MKTTEEFLAAIGAVIGPGIGEELTATTAGLRSPDSIGYDAALFFVAVWAGREIVKLRSRFVAVPCTCIREKGCTFVDLHCPWHGQGTMRVRTGAEMHRERARTERPATAEDAARMAADRAPLDDEPFTADDAAAVAESRTAAARGEVLTTAELKSELRREAVSPSCPDCRDAELNGPKVLDVRIQPRAQGGTYVAIARPPRALKPSGEGERWMQYVRWYDAADAVGSTHSSNIAYADRVRELGEAQHQRDALLVWALRQEWSVREGPPRPGPDNGRPPAPWCPSCGASKGDAPPPGKDRFGYGHTERCTLDAALTLAGLPDQASRDAERTRLGATDEKERA